MAITPRQLAASLRAAEHVAHREVIAAFVSDPATERWPNPFAETRAGTVRHVWSERAREYHLLGIEVVGIAELLAVIAKIEAETPLVHEILRAGSHSAQAHVFHLGDGCRVIGAVLHAKPGVPLPPISKHAGSRHGRRSSSVVTRQLDLFASDGP